MKISCCILFLLLSLLSYAQIKKVDYISASYFGEMVTHPGIKLGVVYDLKSNVVLKNEIERIQKFFFYQPNIVYYYHRRYQTGLSFINDFYYTRIKEKGNLFSAGVSLGLLHTFIPNVYEVLNSNSVSKIFTGHNYFLSNYFVCIGRELKVNRKLILLVYLQPQFMYAIPSFYKGIGYFALEIGVKYKIFRRK